MEEKLKEITGKEQAAAPVTGGANNANGVSPSANGNAGGAPESYALDVSGNGNALESAPKLTFLKKLLGAEPGSGSKSSAADKGAVPRSRAPAAEGNVFTRVFGAIQPGPATHANGNQPAASIPSLSTLLGRPPEFSARDYSEAEKRRTKTARLFFQAAVALAVIIYLFFYVQLNPGFTLFGPNAAQRFAASNSEAQKIQTDLNLVNFRMARLILDEVNTKIDEFQDNFARVAEKQSAEKAKTVGLEIRKLLADAQKIFSAPLGIDVYSRQPITFEEREANFERLLSEALAAQTSAVASQQNPNTEEIRIIANIARLAENKRFRSFIANQDIPALTDEQLSEALKRIREEGTDELSIVSAIRTERLDWEKTISAIHDATRRADLYYGQGLFKTVGGFLFSSYRFDSKTGRISISGLTKTSDSKTFSFIAKLVDSIESSPEFKDIDFRQFTKSRDENGDFSSSINLDFSLE